MSEQDYKAAFKSLCADMGVITALLGLEGYTGVDLVLRAITDLVASRTAAEAESAVLVAEVESWTNGSYHRNYKIKWLRDVPAGTMLYTGPVSVAGKEAVALSDEVRANIESVDVKTALEVYRKESEKNQRWWTNSDPSREAGFVYGFRCALAVVKDRLGIDAQRDASKAEGQSS
ncbi:hypothetical protein [Pararobbsia alpina]|uniref:Uncharacterized protein n=1 Tax=Pararobbsia alpina TaxID=621374 RepID=A0A6S7B255_9BURK|nr:hypothetical protein [Pararobbsia alpina]CAB3784665.1 hypothetical protein LMG28138_01854 [Pararobbsia alpina]